MELLSPAGDRERLEMAIFYGADAVYLAGRQFGMRSSVVAYWSLPSAMHPRLQGT